MRILLCVVLLCGCAGRSPLEQRMLTVHEACIKLGGKPHWTITKGRDGYVRGMQCQHMQPEFYVPVEE